MNSLNLNVMGFKFLENISMMIRKIQYEQNLSSNNDSARVNTH